MNLCLYFSPHHFSNGPSLKRNFNVSSLKDEQKEAAVHLLRWKDIAAISPTGFEESLIYQLYAKEMQMVSMLLFSLFNHSKAS